MRHFVKYFAVALFVATLAMIVAAGGSASPNKANRFKVTGKLPRIVLYEMGGVYSSVAPKELIGYDLYLNNDRKARLKRLRIDFYFPQQVLDRKKIVLVSSLPLKRSRWISGNHVRWILKNLSRFNPVELRISNVHVADDASGTICNRFLLTYKHQTGDYSSGCMAVGSGG